MKTTSVQTLSFKTDKIARIFFFLLFGFIQIYLLRAQSAEQVKSEIIQSQSAKQNQDRALKLVILGDSLTEGYGVAQESSFPFLIQSKFIESKQNVKIISSGSSGSTSASALQRLKWIAKDKPDYVLLLLGSNDGLRGLSVEQTEKNLSEAVIWAKSQNIKVAVGQLHVPPNYSAEYEKKFSALYANVSRKHKVELAPFILENVAGKKELNLADGIHPNEKGHKIVADNLYQFLKKWIKQ